MNILYVEVLLNLVSRISVNQQVFTTIYDVLQTWIFGSILNILDMYLYSVREMHAEQIFYQAYVFYLIILFDITMKLCMLLRQMFHYTM